MDLVSEADAVLREIVTERIHQELPGDTPAQRFARRVTLAALLRSDVEPQQPPLTIPVSPVLPVEPVISEPPAEIAEVPGAMLAGETLEEVSPPSPPPVAPVPDVTPVVVTPVSVPRAEDRDDFDPQVAARNYVWECLLERKAVNASLVGDYLGTTLSSDIRKFVSRVQDDFNVKATGKPGGIKDKTDMKQAINANYAALSAAIAAVSDDEPEDDDLQEIEAEAVTVAAPSVKSVTKGIQKQAKSENDRPQWWNVNAIRYCVKCKGIIVPRRYGDKQTFEVKSQYDQRKYCGNPCIGSPGRKTPSFRPEGEAEQAEATA